MIPTCVRYYLGLRHEALSAPLPAVRAITSRLAFGGILCLLILLFSVPNDAHAGVYGEITRFGEGGGLPKESPGQINDEEREYRAAGGEQLRAHLLGVDPEENNSVFVLDEPKEFEQKTTPMSKKELNEGCGEEKEIEEEEELPIIEAECFIRSGPITRHFRLLKFSPNKNGEYQEVASTEFEEKAPEPRGGQPERLAVEGIAVNPKDGLLYVLALDDRHAGIAHDEAGVNTREPHGLDEPVASTLFAFSTQDLAPAGNDPESLGAAVLTGPNELAAQSSPVAEKKAEPEPLLEPTGMTVDPKTGDIIIVAHEDPTEAFFDRDYEDQETKAASPDHFVMQRIAPNGELVKGGEGRWVDTENFFKHERPQQGSPNSPVVVLGPEHEERVDVEYEGGIVQLPDNFAETTTPKYLEKTQAPEALSSGIIRAYPLGQEGLDTEFGGALAASWPEGSTIYAPGQIENQPHFRCP